MAVNMSHILINRSTNRNSTEVQPVLGLFLGTISLITVVMNILVLYAVKTEKKLQTVGNLYIVSLSCADVIVGAAVMPLNIVYLLKDKWILTRKACLFWLSMDYVASTASIFSLFILCVDRYRSVQQPLKYLKYRTKTRASVMISIAWLLSFLWVIPILGWRKFTDHSNMTIHNRTYNENVCETDFCRTTWFKVLTATINFYVPSLLMLWFYANIYRAVCKHFQHRLCYLKETWGKLRTQSVFQSQKLHVNRDRKAAKQLGVIMVVFMLCWIPYFVLFMVMAFCEICYNRPFHIQRWYSAGSGQFWRTSSRNFELVRRAGKYRL
uniref:Histamine receptor H1 n=1 Tax=Pseudonaja textilis TaxID=8673 RepID=A0A670YDC2_PSETE